MVHNSTMSTPDDDDTRLTIRVPSAVYERLSASARQQDRSLNQQIVAELRSGPPKPQPTGWGFDELGKFSEQARWNGFSTFVRVPELYTKLDAIHRLFGTGGDQLRDPDHFASALLFTRAHAAFLAAAQLAINTQSGEVPAMVRACIECALYAYDLAEHPGHAEAWFNRNDSPTARKRARSLLKPSDMLKDLASVDAALGSVVRKIYESSIDSGAHPNVDAVFGNMRLGVNEDGDHIYTNVILAADDLSVRVGLKTVARGGVAALLILERIFARRFEETGVSVELRKVSEGL
jgi:hypothetical protein